MREMINALDYKKKICLFLMFLDNVLSVFIKIYLHVDTIFIYIILFRLFYLPTHN